MIVRAIVTLAKTLGLEVIAEGIETQRQLDLLKSLGCERGQGFLFARPMDFPSLCDLLDLSPTLDLPVSPYTGVANITGIQ